MCKHLHAKTYWLLGAKICAGSSSTHGALIFLFLCRVFFCYYFAIVKCALSRLGYDRTGYEIGHCGHFPPPGWF